MDFHSLYAAFEIHPSKKGASTHISQMTDELANSRSPELVCAILGDEVNNVREGIHYELFDRQVEHYLDRGSQFSAWLKEILRKHGNFEIAQFRDIWSGMPVLESKKAWLTIFEVNGFPSIELPYRYPDLSRDTLKKIRTLEMYCLTETDLIICPSYTIKNFLLSLGIMESKIEVITNGATIPENIIKPPDDLPGRYILYFGALQLWQGIDTMIKAFRYLSDMDDLNLVICSSQREKFSKPYFKLAEEWGISDRIQWRYRLEENELNSVIQGSLFTIAPLKDTTRNIVQGCSPLKIFESMANGKPVLASDIPPVREIITDGFDGHLVRPDRPSDLSRMIRFMVDYPDITTSLGIHARETIKNKFLWKDIKLRLQHLYLRHSVYAA